MTRIEGRDFFMIKEFSFLLHTKMDYLKSAMNTIEIEKLKKLDQLTEGDYEAFLYDCDGTLADNMMAHKLAYQEVAANYGIALDTNIINETAGWPTKLVAKEIGKRYNVSLPESFPA